jgi:hypothetical protein
VATAAAPTRCRRESVLDAVHVAAPTTACYLDRSERDEHGTAHDGNRFEHSRGNETETPASTAGRRRSLRFTTSSLLRTVDPSSNSKISRQSVRVVTTSDTGGIRVRPPGSRHTLFLGFRDTHSRTSSPSDRLPDRISRGPRQRGPRPRSGWDGHPSGRRKSRARETVTTYQKKETRWLRVFLLLRSS